MAPVYIILLGPPGVGKSTQGALLSRRYPLVALSTGNLLRAEVQAGTPLGREARAAIESGQLVSDDVIDTMVRTHLNALPASHGFLLDGFPRTAAQAAALDTMLHELHMPLTVVVEPLPRARRSGSAHVESPRMSLVQRPVHLIRFRSRAMPCLWRRAVSAARRQTGGDQATA